MALLSAPSLAAPITQQIGIARATVVVSPDPPRVGSDTVTLLVSGVSQRTLAQTTVRYATLMPSMNMSGPHGTAARVAGRSGEWRLDVRFGMPALWTLRLQFSGGVSGAIGAHLLVAAAAKSSAPAATPGPVGSMRNMATSSAGDASAWRTATFALIAVILIGTLALSRDRRPATIAMIVIAGLAVVGLAFAQSRSGQSSTDMGSMTGVRGSAPVPVTLATVGDDSIGTQISAPANVRPYLVQDIVARAPGLLTDFSAYTGDRLSAGDIVARLLEPELQSNAQAARSAASAAQHQRSSAQYDASAMRADVVAKRQQLAYWNAEIARERSLLVQGAVSVQEYQSEKAQATVARSNYDAALANLAGANAGIQTARDQAAQAAWNAQSQSITAGYTNVIVPDTSIVMKRLVAPGVYVQPGTSILQVAVVNRLRVQAQISQRDVADVRIGTPIEVTFADGKVLRSRISSISPVVDSSTHTATAEAIVSNPDDRYQPGAFAHVILIAQRRAPNPSFVVPSGAIVGGATTAVWADVGGAAHRIPVTVVSDDGTVAQVTGDLRAGMRVVVTGADDLEEGQAVAEGSS